MNTNQGNGRLMLKKRTNWFAASDEFLKAMRLLSDGAFKLFAFVCLKADRHTATFTTSSDHLCVALGKPRQVIRICLAELKAKQVCAITDDEAGLGCSLTIAEEFWPYRGCSDIAVDKRPDGYVAAIRQQFLALGCTSGRFGASEEAQAKSLERRGIPCEIVRDAMIVGACRKYVSWLNNGYSEPVSSVAYFESVIQEFLHCPPPADYREYLPFELKRLSNHWTRLQQSRQKTITDLGGSQKDRDRSNTERRDDVVVESRNLHSLSDSR